MTTTRKKVAVFTTSEIFRPYQEKGDKEPIATFVSPSDRKPTNMFTTGNLERALEQGCTVYVVSSRTTLGDHDQWWIDLVGRENIFLADEEKLVHYTDQNKERNRAMAFGWRQLAQLFGIVNDLDWAQSWTDVRYDISEMEGIKLGYEFNPRHCR